MRKSSTFIQQLLQALIILSFTALTSACSSDKKQKENSSTAYIDTLISNMTLQEKIGQMTQINIDMILQGDVFKLQNPHEIDEKKLKTAIQQYHVGSILNTGGHPYSLQKWQHIINSIQKEATNTPNKIPVLYGIDAIHGANYLEGSTLFPQPLAQAATFNPTLVKEIAEATAYETSACGIPWNFSPVLDVARMPLWSRIFETYGEDTYLSTVLGKATIIGYQGENPSNIRPPYLAACAKHFLAYSYPHSGKDRTPTYLSETQLREYFLPPFQEAVKAGVQTLMINSGEINGTPVHANKKILTDLLRNELGFEGIAVTDWEDIIKLHKMHKISPNYKESVYLAIEAGVDMSMVPHDFTFCDLLLELVQEGRISEKRIDQSVKRILTVKHNLGLFENPYAPNETLFPNAGKNHFKNLSYQTASESITLLKNNNNLLPISNQSKVFLTGAASNSTTIINGAWSKTWQGIEEEHYENGNTLYKSLAQQLPKHLLLFEEGTGLDSLKNTKAAIQKAKQADYVVMCIGEKPGTEKPGDINDLNLSQAQEEYIKLIKQQTATPIVLILLENRPQIITKIEPLCDAIIHAYLPSENGLEALIDILYGKVNPSGKLPITYPRYANDLIPYDHKFSEAMNHDYEEDTFNPLYEFGHGLSYTSFTYSELSLSKNTITTNDSLTLSFTLKNTGGKVGKESVLLYISDQVASITPPVKRLKDFTKISLEPNEEKQISFTIKPEQLAFINAENKSVIEEGYFTIQIEKQKAVFYYDKK